MVGQVTGSLFRFSPVRPVLSHEDLAEEKYWELVN